MRLLVASLIVALVGVFVVIWSAPHYAAPVTCVLYALLVQSVRHLRIWKWKSRPLGLALSRALLILLVLETGVNVARRVVIPCGGLAPAIPAASPF